MESVIKAGLRGIKSLSAATICAVTAIRNATIALAVHWAVMLFQITFIGYRGVSGQVQQTTSIEDTATSRRT